MMRERCAAAWEPLRPPVPTPKAAGTFTFMLARSMPPARRPVINGYGQRSTAPTGVSAISPTMMGLFAARLGKWDRRPALTQRPAEIFACAGARSRPPARTVMARGMRPRCATPASAMARSSMPMANCGAEDNSDRHYQHLLCARPQSFPDARHQETVIAIHFLFHKNHQDLRTDFAQPLLDTALLDDVIRMADQRHVTMHLCGQLHHFL